MTLYAELPQLSDLAVELVWLSQDRSSDQS